MNIDEKIKKIEEELKRTERNKATEHHIGKLLARLAKLKRLREKKKQSGGGKGFAIPKEGDATAVLIGFPSVGKSSLLTKLTNAESKVANYAFTTLDVIPGMLEYKGAKIQILDLPGILEGAAEGRGRGKEVLSVIRNADLVIVVVDATQPWQKEIIIRELEKSGVRLNKKRPNITIEKRDKGGITLFNKSNVPDNVIRGVLHEYNIHNAIVTIPAGTDEEDIIDALEKNRIYVKAIFVANKCDLSEKQVPGFINVSTVTGEGLEELKEAIFETLGLIRVWTKNEDGISKEPLVLKKGATVRDVCERIHRDFAKKFKYAQIWGKSARFPGQRVGLEHELKDGDVIQIIIKR